MSKKISSAERNYPTHDRECLGIVSAYREWRCYLEGVPFTCYTHHKPLTQLQTQPQISRRQARWLEFLAGFRPNVVYVQGRYNPADVLSRPPHPPNPTLPDLGQGSTGHPSTGSPALLPNLVALAKGGSSVDPVGNPRSNSAVPVLHKGAVADSMGAARLAPTF
jgi:RNase H-like domain found in reverse transcriptase